MTHPIPAVGRPFAAISKSYWYPVYAFFRRSGKQPTTSQELTQAVLAKIADFPDAGNVPFENLRVGLLTCALRAIAQHSDPGSAVEIMPDFNLESAEQTFAADFRAEETPETLFQRRWAFVVLELSIQEVRREYAAREDSRNFQALRPFLGFSVDSDALYPEVAAALGLQISVVKDAVFHLRQRWREVVFAQLALTLLDPAPEKIKAELVELLAHL